MIVLTRMTLNDSNDSQFENEIADLQLSMVENPHLFS